MAGTSFARRVAERVQELKIGDSVLTREGRSVPVRWIGRQTVAGQFTGELYKPVRVKAGALQDNAAIFLFRRLMRFLVDEVLIQAGALVERCLDRAGNEMFLIRSCIIPVEIDVHSLFLGDNTAVRTFVDNVARANFGNCLALYPEGKSVTEMPYPRAKTYRQVPRATRERLVERGFVLYSAWVASVA